MLTQIRITLALCVALLAGCSRVGDAPSAPPEQLRAFTADLAEQPRTFAGGAPSLEALAAQFTRAVQRRDTATVAALHLSRAEFAYLVYPTHPQAQPPYSLPPDVMWMMTEAESAKGLGNAVARLAEHSVSVDQVACDGVSRQGVNQVHFGCVAIARASRNRGGIRLRLGPIVERGGQFKFASFAAG